MQQNMERDFANRKVHNMQGNVAEDREGPTIGYRWDSQLKKMDCTIKNFIKFVLKKFT